ncbi:protein polybromo-1 isoform X1 [Aplysia californica]|uniref:Protein polybromo-1 isoform X1 n=1 Tax=Aplysia californica TaxID=6500 RepID=A0ABM1VS73_APLCA|nr:protein polybromo-1 isoform X1 [Aplysia californica]XP_035825266.1 protein polybromo-1 isoform X1 [Aplysia californica]XP_035825267.1 protein polybromo-1 isoform X1 [Aplysia californica]
MPRKRPRPDMKEEGEEIPGPSQVKKKRKILNYDPHEIILELYDTVRNHKTEDGRLLCESFIRVPKRRSAADYYDVVTTPIDLLKIQQRVKTDNYDYVDQLSADVLLMVNNAKAYYKKTSQEYKDACDLMELYEETRADLVEAVFGSGDRSDRLSRKTPVVKDTVDLPEPEEKDDDESEDEEEEEEDGNQSDASKQPSEGRERSASVSEEIAEDLEQLFAAIVTTRDGDRDISQAFQLLPQKSKYPQYYDVIKNPIDLKMIATKIQESKYTSLDDLERDLLLMVKNAKAFNEPKSLIYRDAVTLKRVIGERKRELEYKKSGHVKSSGRLSKTKDRIIIQKMSAVCAALKYQSSEDDGASSSQFEMDSEAEGTGNDLVEDDPQWILYNHVKNVTGDDGDSLSEPFQKLPSKKFYPDYYKEIKKPMSLHKIRYKIEMNMYDTLMDLARDFHLTFENAKKYNQDESQLYKDAVSLHQAMVDKLRELDADLADEFMEDLENDNEDEDDEEEEATIEGERNSEELTAMEEESVSTPTTVRGRPRKSSLVPNSTPDSEKKKSSAKKSGDDSLKKRLRTLYSTVYDYSDANGRLLRPIFMVLPSRKDYPDYYQVIMEPIDLTMIEGKIKSEKYPSEQALLADFELMFNNARHYNEEGSQLYQDANTLDRVLRTKWKTISQQAKLSGGRGKSKVTEASPLAQKLLELYESVRDYQDRSGRALSSPFIKLPNKTDYPDYYEVIKRPIDMQRIQQKMMLSQYEGVEDMVTDFVLLFDNACKYNEPESVIYRDALALQRVCFQKKLELMSSCMNEVPDVKALTQDLMKNLFVSTFNYEDDEGRCYSDSFAELVEKDKGLQVNGEVSEPPLTFDQIRKNLDKGRYQRVDRFQDDMFKMFERARQLSRLDSQLYEDAVEMQKFFITTRDDLCKNGELLLTPALSYTDRHLTLALEAEQKEKSEAEKEQVKQEEEEKNKEGADGSEECKVLQDSNGGEEDCEYKGQVYSKGDFVYIPSRESPEPHIMVIESFSRDESGQVDIKGQWFYRPGETYHLATRKFLEKEVFRSDTRQSTPISEIVGRCCVMFVKDYFKFKPEGIPDKDVYVCESRYILRGRCFKKIKIWQTPVSKNLNIVPREVPLTPIRVASMFADKSANESALDESDTVIDKKRESIPSEIESEDGNVYYDQYVTDNGCFKLGDGVYISNPGASPIIARMDKIWTDSLGEAFFHYACFLRPADVEHAPNRLFYKQEVFQASIEDCALIKNIVGKCCVLHMKDYCTSRPTEIAEQDVFINESKYQEADKSIKRQKLIKKYALSPKVVDDEIYFFRKPIALEKEPSPLLMKAGAEDSLFVDTEESQDVEPEASNDATSVSNDAPSPAPTKSHKKKTPNPRRQPSGYIVFAGEARKQICQDNPSCSFGDISKIVGTRWRALTKAEKDVFEEKARKIAEEMVAKQAEADKALNDSVRSQSPWSDYGGQTPGNQPCPPSPVFVSVPPRSQKLLHSEVYIRYIERLNTDSHSICNWDRTLTATQENTPGQPEANLPGDWLAHGAGCHGNVSNALWALRDFMLKDAVNLARTVPFDDL